VIAAPSTQEQSEAEDEEAQEDEEEFPTFFGIDEADLNDEDEDVQSEPEFDSEWPPNLLVSKTSFDPNRL